MKLTVEVRISGHGTESTEQVEISQEEIEQLACDKVRENDASPRIHASGKINVEMNQ